MRYIDHRMEVRNQIQYLELQPGDEFAIVVHENMRIPAIVTEPKDGEVQFELIKPRITVPKHVMDEVEFASIGEAVFEVMEDQGLIVNQVSDLSTSELLEELKTRSEFIDSFPVRECADAVITMEDVRIPLPSRTRFILIHDV